METPSCNYSALISQGFHADTEERAMSPCWDTQHPFLPPLHGAPRRSRWHQREASREQILMATWSKATERESCEREMLQVPWLLQLSTSTL